MTTDFWNSRYGEPGFAYGTTPNAFLASQQARLRPGMTALAVADGEGRNGVWLAEQGLDVLSVDASAVGLAKARELAAQRGVRLATEQVDLATWAWPVAHFDVVAAIYIHLPSAIRRRVHRAMLRALKPGGLLVMEAFTPRQLSDQHPSGGPKDPDMLFTAAMLREDFTGADDPALPHAAILQLDELVTELNEGKYHVGPGSVVRMLLRRAG
jgi:2-polyprenyl-3-methyl-5-hydroxy-6-metoxy-1,4-benzoquinol methylase